jgi:hypothetical protein
MKVLLAILLAFSAAVFAGQTNQHWSLQPLKRPTIPGRASANPIDAFIEARLREKGLRTSRPADRATLIRRLTFDLHGLPPTPSEIDEFIRDRSERAYENLVERLLVSPRYGERWARHWLDIVRYTESQGFEYDRLRDNAWPYRDYVIKSFNEDKPYDRFVMEQIAGDALQPATTESINAVSMLVCGPWDQAGSSQANVAQRMTTREEELEDLIGVVGQTFLGLTINCARCHAHKFDPISHEEYYRVKAVFEGVKHGERTISESPKIVSYVGARAQPEPTKQLRRGNVTMPLKVVTPGGLSAIAELPADFNLAADAPEAERRVKFAQWVVDPRNPLPARVMANRVWQYHFGQGLVASPSDFGVNGAGPTHPELLDYLACELIESGWSVKHLHRRIVTSAAYRQQSHFNANAASIDADAQFLWRFPPRRLEAEEIRDAMLMASGEINLQLGGRSFRPFKIANFNSDFYEIKDLIGPDYNRRTVYRMNVNSGKDPLLDAFDCPDPSVKTPRRGVTTTPMQALALMNNSFVQRQAAKLSDRALQESAGDLKRAIKSAYSHALSRAPDAKELAEAVVVAKHRGLPHVCWALFNSTEFIYVR